jgi:hypothetical protein
LVIILADFRPASAESDQSLRVDGALHFSRAKITLVGDRKYLASEVTVRGDSVSFMRQRIESIGYEPRPPSAKDHRSFPLARVERIEVVNGTRAGLGAGIGLLAGLGIWTAIARANDESLAETALWGMLIFVIPGAGIGALVGSGAEDWDTVYEREP